MTYLPTKFIPTYRQDEINLKAIIGEGSSILKRQFSSVYVPFASSLNVYGSFKRFNNIALNTPSYAEFCLLQRLRDMPRRLLDAYEQGAQEISREEYLNIVARLNVGKGKIETSISNEEFVKDLDLIDDMGASYLKYLQHTDLTKGLPLTEQGDYAPAYNGSTKRRKITLLELNFISNQLIEARTYLSSLHWKAFCFNYLSDRKQDVAQTKNDLWVFNIADEPRWQDILVQIDQDILPVLAKRRESRFIITTPDKDRSCGLVGAKRSDEFSTFGFGIILGIEAKDRQYGVITNL